jgi:hypothetical protein
MEDFLFYFNAYRVPAQHVIAFLLAGAAWRWGGAPERWLTLSFLATMVVPTYFVWWLLPELSPEQPVRAPYILLDMIAAALFVGIALRANRNYPLWIAGFQLVAIGAYLVKVLAPVVSPLALLILIVGPAYCQLALLVIGFIRHIRRERRYGPYRAWRIAPPAIGGVAA